MKKTSIKGVGLYLPSRIVTTEEIAKRLNVDPARITRASGIDSRHIVTNETSSYMGAEALKEALEDAELQLQDLDCIINASGVPQQAIPSTASLIQKQMNGSDTGIPCFDINSTCLSFVTAFDVANMAILTGKYKRIAIVSTEIASAGINEKVIESAVLFGDGASAVIMAAIEGEQVGVLGSHMETYSDGSSFTEIKGGGTLIPPRAYTEHPLEDFLFHMDGRAVFKMTLKKMDGFLTKLLNNAGIAKQDLQMVIPHQASGSSMEIVRKKLGFSVDQFMNIIRNHGNMIAASIPAALYYAIRENRIKRGDKVMLIGTSAGLSIGGLIFEY